MQKITVLFVALFMAQLGFSQKGIEIGLNFTPGSPWVLNDEDFGEGDALNYRGTFGYNAGLVLGYNFSDGIGIHSGLMLSKQGQNYITDYQGVAKVDQFESSRQLSYLRVPVLLKFNGSTDASSSSYFRIGPHFDILSSAKYKDERLKQDYDMKKVFEENNGDKYDLYKKLVVGVTLEFGGMVNITESLKLVFMLHMSGSLTNPEADASRLRIKSSEIDGDAYKLQMNNLSYYSTGFGFYPFPSQEDTNGSRVFLRENAWNVMGGLTVGFHYVLLTDN